MPATARKVLHWYPSALPLEVPKVAKLHRVTSRMAPFRRQPAVRGVRRQPAYTQLDAIINVRLKEEADHLKVSKSWLQATIMADALRINLDKKMRAFVTDGRS